MKVLKKLHINKKNILKYIKSFKENALYYISKYEYIIFLSLPFLSMDIITRIFGKDIKFFNLFSLSPNLFTLCWIVLFLGLTLGFKKKIGKIFYLFINLFFIIIFITNNIYYSMTKIFFDFNLLESASEGAPYIIDTIKNGNPLVYLSTLFIIVLMILAIKKIPYKTKNNSKILIPTIIIFLISHALIPLTFGKANEELTWSSWRNPRNIYNSFNDNNKSMKISGLYEYTFRNFYITFLKTERQENSEDLEFLNNAFDQETTKNENKYTGIFKDKNIIFLQLEGIDNFLLKEDIMPNLYQLTNNAINFENHFSYYNGGGSTFNSEFAVNTGFITPLSYTQNAYTFNKNDFPYSMANLFKERGYSVNAFHMNSSEYYSRGINYLNWGYDNYYGLLDTGLYSGETHYLDTELLKNETFYQKIFNLENNFQDEKNKNNEETKKLFVDYIITYSNHIPFSSTRGICNQLLNKKYEEELTNDKTFSLPELTEFDCLKIQSKETDDMIGLLIQGLIDNDLYDNTVIVVFTDHYLYTLSDKSILEKYKETSNNLINNTPFLIWSKDFQKTNIKKVTSQLNILPTVLNLFGMEYNPNNYIGEDALDSNYKGYVFFNDYSWYNGNIYVEGGKIKDYNYNSEIEEINYQINYLIKKNDLTLKYNYFKHLK